MGRGVTTVAAASIVAAAAFAGYATGSVGVVTDAVDNVLVRSEKPKPKQPWEPAGKKREPGPGASAPFRRRVEDGTKARPLPASGSEFKRVLEERAAAQAARNTEFEKRLGATDQPAAPSPNNPFRRRVEAESPPAKPKTRNFATEIDKKAAKRKKDDQRPFEKRVEGSGG